ncbi:hypothetical protein [Patulibacter sp.]|uniref:hypothetical protein n=1 Tax=Patulibacter sp. TaxID=1912859 RepID=UPI002721FA47|nr:hypothetical protein [Patulibacter sp.]MDO9409748.1 hypothetical protein [Patulibacter sp.]
MIQLPQLQESLLLANDRLVDRARRRARRFRLGLMTSAAVVSVGGAAVAGTALWGPVLGFEDGNRPSASSTPVPSAQAATLGVLGRDQTVADRGPLAREALASVSRQYAGVRLAGIRVLPGWTAGSALVLVPVADLRAAAPGSPAGQDQLCVHARVSASNSARSCFGTEDVRRGAATGSIGALAWGLVPNGVSRVVVHTRAGGTVERDVDGNAFTVDASIVDPDTGLVDWLDAEGRAVTPEGGMPMRLPVAG